MFIFFLASLLNYRSVKKLLDLELRFQSNFDAKLSCYSKIKSSLQYWCRA